MTWLIDDISDWLANLLPVERFDGSDGLGDGGMPRPRRGRTEVPDVRGLPMDEARHALVAEGFKVEIVRLEDRPAPVMGTVVAQSPAPGTSRRRGRSVTVSVQHPRDPRADPRR